MKYLFWAELRSNSRWATQNELKDTFWGFCLIVLFLDLFFSFFNLTNLLLVTASDFDFTEFLYVNVYPSIFICSFWYFFGIIFLFLWLFCPILIVFYFLLWLLLILLNFCLYSRKEKETMKIWVCGKVGKIWVELEGEEPPLSESIYKTKKIYFQLQPKPYAFQSNLQIPTCHSLCFCGCVETPWPQQHYKENHFWEVSASH